MPGVSPFLERFSALPPVESMLASQPQALLGLLRLVRRVQHAARWARDWAIRRHDLDVERIAVAAPLARPGGDVDVVLAPHWRGAFSTRSMPIRRCAAASPKKRCTRSNRTRLSSRWCAIGGCRPC